jgi:uncharacterized membrane protein YqhA
MGSIIGKMRYLVLIAVIGSLLASVGAFIYGFVKTINIILKLITSAFSDEAANISFIELMDTYLIATALLIFALGMYELFIGDLNLPEWLVIRDFNGLKVKLSGVIVLVLAVTFLKHLVDWTEPEKTLLLGTATALVAGVLILFNRSENSKE